MKFNTKINASSNLATTASIYFINNGFKNKKRKIFLKKHLNNKQMFGKIFLNKKGDDNIEQFTSRRI